MQILNMDKPPRLCIKPTIKPAPLYYIKAIIFYDASLHFVRAAELISSQVNGLRSNGIGHLIKLVVWASNGYANVSAFSVWGYGSLHCNLTHYFSSVDFVNI